jgi:sugar lactone lactonase YvrE
LKLKSHLSLLVFTLGILPVLFLVSLNNRFFQNILPGKAAGPVITSVYPEPPYCTLRNSTKLYERRLEITGEGFPNANRNLQFKKVSTGELSIHFGMEVDWVSASKITVDMARIQDLLWADAKVTLAVRLTNEVLEPITDWSAEFTLAEDATTCGAVLPTPTPEPPADPVRGSAGDLWADVIVGQRDFSEVTPHEVVPFKVFNPGGVTVDRSVFPGRAYVWDSGNSRILGVDLAKCYAKSGPCSADIVLGQPSASGYSAANGDSGFQHYPQRPPASADSLCGIAEDTLSILENKSFVSMAAAETGDLYVPDSCNNRVLKYKSPFTSDAAADEVWGQADFTGNLCNQGESAPTNSSLCFWGSQYGEGSAVELDAQGNLWIADTGNNRILRFARNPSDGSLARTADLVLGQNAFTTATAGTGLNQLNSPSAVRFGPENWLYVADTRNDRVLVFKPPFSSGMSAAQQFGANFDDPLGLEMDLKGQGVWIFDRGNSMIELWDWNGTSVLKVLGKDTYRLGHDWGSPVADGGGGIGIDGEGNILAAVYVYVQDVLRFADPIPAPKPGAVYQPDKKLFSPPGGYNHVGNSELRAGEGVAIFGNQLIAADGNRLMFWNDIQSLYNGKPADGILGSSEFSYFPSCCGRLKTDQAARLWVQNLDGGIDIYPLPLTSQAAAKRALQPGASLPVLGGGSIQIGGTLSGHLPLGQGEFLWITDTNNHRVLRIRNPLTNPVIDVVLGQKDKDGHECNQGLIPAPNTGTEQVASADMLCYPGALSQDRFGNLYVSDHSLEVQGNYRLLVFKADLFPANPAAAIFGVNASKIFPYRNTQPALTFEPAFDSQNRMVVGFNSYSGTRFVGMYEDPLGAETNPSAYLKDFGSMPYAIAFDRFDNLFVADSNRNRVLVYWNPFDNEVQADHRIYLPWCRR